MNVTRLVLEHGMEHEANKPQAPQNASADHLRASAASYAPLNDASASAGSSKPREPPQNFSFPPENSSKGSAVEPEPTQPHLANQTLRLDREESFTPHHTRSYASHEPKGTCEPPLACPEDRGRVRGEHQWVMSGREIMVLFHRRNCVW